LFSVPPRSVRVDGGPICWWWKPQQGDELATIINRLLASLVIRCSKDEGVRDYFEVGVFGYGARVAPGLHC